ncbi:MAG: TylF/MycF/NovP-related O-methyltransferase [Terriglobales bacterium]
MFIACIVVFDSRRIHPSHRMATWRKFMLGMRMVYTTRRVLTGTSPKMHMVMALRILESDPTVPGVVIECGTWKGATAANLSLVCKIVNRKLIVFDSFRGLPASDSLDREAKYYKEHDYCGTLEEVKQNISRYGDLSVCDFRQGWFENTLPNLREPVLVAYVDVDLESSFDTCIRHLWPRLVEGGTIFTDECASTDYCALFWSERWWNENFQATPPGLIGSGSGLPLGGFYLGPAKFRSSYPLQKFNSGAYAYKGMSGRWTYYRSGQDK